ncbi:MAG: hypothetical protein WC716_04580 [Chitinophagaceae bacterium]|jgi:hypothetical protein
MREQIDLELALEQLKGVKSPSSDGLSYHKLMTKINQVQREKAPKVMIFGVLLGIGVLLSFNIFALDNKIKSKENNLVNELGLMDNTSIYGGI